ncbi:DUF423 domain-containing protein [Melioribacteraceae bacterium 4301-Me]|uniref:DUF423 domain-containing protein n=1 Tax=Pyranulibacter aquaticus TaxID=3163344 RepID=UPI0035969335
MKNNKFILLAAVMGFLGVALGAFGAHGLKIYLNKEMQEIYSTGVEYHLVHAVVLLVLAFQNLKEFKTAYFFIFSGILLFSFSLYLYSITAQKAFAIITPFGGLCFLIGWVMIAVGAVRLKKQ